MFNSQQKKYDVYTYSITTNEWGEKIKSPILFKSVLMFISLRTYNNFTSNDVRLQEVTHIGITSDKTIEKGMMIDNRYSVEFVNNDGRESILFLKEVI